MGERPKPKCNDTRECCFREKGKCTVLQESYKKDGQCKFCKDRISVINGIGGQREQEPEKPEPKEKPVVIKEVLEEIKEKLRFCANEHGAYWHEYADILTQCRTLIHNLSDENDALYDTIQNLRERLEWKPVSEKMPADNTLLVATVIVDDAPEIRSGVFLADEGFLLDGFEQDVDALAWIEMPDPWEGAYEAEENTEQNEAE